MIVIGYQGIGKSTLAKKDRKYLDLESSNFWVDGKRDENWYKVYCKQAINFSKQGYIVFTSSHQVVRDYFKEIKDKEIIIIVYPSLELKDKWIGKLKDRYKESQLDKDYKAWKNAEDRYEENIKELFNDGFFIMPIKEIDYNLEDLIEGFIKLDIWNQLVRGTSTIIPTIIEIDKLEEIDDENIKVTYTSIYESKELQQAREWDKTLINMKKEEDKVLEPYRKAEEDIINTN